MPTLNFRDVGTCINRETNKNLMQENRLYRGGKISELFSLDEIENPRTIVNVRKHPDPMERFPGAKFLHFPILNSVEKYDTTLTDVRTWLNKILAALCDPNLQFPVYLHCASGKDRTGVVVASLLYLLGISEDIIVKEYLRSEGEKSREQILSSLQGFKTKKTILTMCPRSSCGDCI